MQTVNQVLSAKSGQMFSVAPTDSVLHAIEVMATHEIGSLLVMDGVKLLGVMTERDYARKVILKKRSSYDTPVGDVMTSPPTTVPPEATVHACMELMTECRLRHLPVVKAGREIGIVSIGDLVKAVIEDQSQQIEHLERYIAG